MMPIPSTTASPTWHLERFNRGLHQPQRKTHLGRPNLSAMTPSPGEAGGERSVTAHLSTALGTSKPPAPSWVAYPLRSLQRVGRSSLSFSQRHLNSRRVAELAGTFLVGGWGRLADHTLFRRTGNLETAST